jgi:hypothetical protein
MPKLEDKWLILLALLYTLLNAIKPLQVDDAAYYYYAAHIAQHPLDPYGFEIYWYQVPEPANGVLAPPVSLYWWSAAIRLFGERPFLWKLWLLPFSLLLIFALHRLARRFAQGLEMQFVVLTVFSPAFLPSLNLMLDVPAAALGLTALTLFFRASDSCWVWRAAGAGLIAGLAMQTKYTAVLAHVAMLLYSAIIAIIASQATWRRRLAQLGLGLAAAGISLAFFVSWEIFIAAKYGESHFLHLYRLTDHDLREQLLMAVPLLPLLGGVGAIYGLVGLAAVGCRSRIVGFIASIIAAGFLVIAGEGLLSTLITMGSGSGSGLEPIEVPFYIEQTIFSYFGGMVSISFALALKVLLWRRNSPPRRRRWRVNGKNWFLALWLLLEVAGYLALTPFTAVRRVLGVVIVGTLVASRLAAHTCRTPPRRRLMNRLVAANVALGFVFYAVDLRDSWAPKEAVTAAVQFIREEDSNARIWYVGHWGFQYYAEKAGLRPVIPGPDPKWQPLCRGDWLIVPDSRWEQQFLTLDAAPVQEIAAFRIADYLPLRTVRCFYGTDRGIPLEHHEGPRMTVTVYRVVDTFLPEHPGIHIREGLVTQ